MELKTSRYENKPHFELNLDKNDLEFLLNSPTGSFLSAPHCNTLLNFYIFKSLKQSNFFEPIYNQNLDGYFFDINFSNKDNLEHSFNKIIPIRAYNYPLPLDVGYVSIKLNEN